MNLIAVCVEAVTVKFDEKLGIEFSVHLLLLLSLLDSVPFVVLFTGIEVSVPKGSG